MNKKIVTIGIILVLLVIGLSGCTNTEKSNAENSRNVKMYQKSKEYIKESLVAPATAEFPDISEATIKQITENSWTVFSYVDAENNFGALIRNWFMCEFIEYDTLILLDANMGKDKSEISYKWDKVVEFHDDDDMITDSFVIDTYNWKVNYVVHDRINSNPFFTVFIEDMAGESAGLPIMASDDTGSNGEDRYFEGKGEYYFDISAIDCSYYLYVYEGIDIS